MIISVTSAKYVRDYILDVTFDNGEVRRVDFFPYIEKGKIFSPLQNLNKFKDFSIDTTITWKNGADIAPDTLYHTGIPVVNAA